MLGKFDGNENYSSSNLLTFNKLQKQPPNVFYETIRSCSLKLRNIHRKTTLLESLLNKVTEGMQLYQKQTSTLAFSCKCEIFKKIYFDEYLQIEILPEIPKFKILHVDFLFLSLLLPRCWSFSINHVKTSENQGVLHNYPKLTREYQCWSLF